jgi:sigma-B regulation protein RsbU (phosphoserine phosphatase)
MNPDILTPFPLFANLPANEISALLEILQVQEFEPGTVIFAEGSLTQSLYGVLDGEVEIVKSLGTPDERIMALRQRGALLGEMSLFNKIGNHTAGLRARTPLTMLVIPLNSFQSLVYNSPGIAYELARTLSARLEESENLTIHDLREKNRQLTQAYQDLQAAQAAIIEKEKLEHELQIASEIQRGVLPEELPTYPGLDFGALMIPARQIGGDFYDFIPLDDQHIGVVVGDVCDKGVPAALFMTLTYSLLRAEAFRQSDPGVTLRAVNQNLLQINHSNQFVTLLYGVLDCATRRFHYIRAGHPSPLVLDGGYRPVEVPHGVGQPLGLFDNPRFDEQIIAIPPGGVLLIYSDGLSETVEDCKTAAALPELCSSLLSGQNLTAQAICDRLWQTVGQSPDTFQVRDDFTVVSLKNSQA